MREQCLDVDISLGWVFVGGGVDEPCLPESILYQRDSACSTSVSQRSGALLEVLSGSSSYSNRRVASEGAFFRC
jgi:hypothetical protein